MAVAFNMRRAPMHPAASSPYGQVTKRDNGASPPRDSPTAYISGAMEYEPRARGSLKQETNGAARGRHPVIVRGAAEYPDFVSEDRVQRPVLVRGATQYPEFVANDAVVRGASRYFESGFGKEAAMEDAALGNMDDQMGECLEGLMQLRETRDLVVMTMNLQHFASWPKDPDAGYYELCRITEVQPPPDIICVQEGLAGRDVLSELGYQLVGSSRSSAQPLAEALYNDAGALAAVREAYRDRLLVNELYVRIQTSASPVEWEVIDHGAKLISSKHQTVAKGKGLLPLAVRSVAWVKLQHRTRPDGPFVFLLNSQLSGGDLEKHIFSHSALAEERRKQVGHALDFVDGLLAGDDLGLLVGDLGMATDENDEAHQSSPFGLLDERGWKLAYGQAQVGPTSSSGQLVDHMAMSHAVPALVKVFATTNQQGDGQPAVTQVPLSDHNVVKATFSVRYSVSELDQAIINGQPDIDDAEGQHIMDQAVKDMTRRQNFPLAYRPDPSDTSYVGTCARYEFECQDLMNERSSEQQAMEEITASLSEQMWRLRDQCSDQIQGKSVLIQRINEANDSVTGMNDTWAATRYALQAELEEERHQKEQIEAQLRAEEAQVQAQIAEGSRQLENMRLARRSLGRHLSSMGKLKAVMMSDIEDEKRMSSELGEAGEKQLIEWTEQQDEMRSELLEALAAHKAEHDAWKADMEAELQLARKKKSEADSEEAQVEQRLRRAQEEMSQQSQELRLEVAEKSQRLQELCAEVQEAQAERRSHEEAGPLDEQAEMSIALRIGELSTEREQCQAEIATLEQDCMSIRFSVEKLTKEVGQATPSSRKENEARSQVIKGFQASKAHLQTAIEEERKIQEDLKQQLAAAQKRPGLFACFRPRVKEPIREVADEPEILALPSSSTARPAAAAPLALPAPASSAGAPAMPIATLPPSGGAARQAESDDSSWL